jgi:hypothetical protein
MAMVTISCVQGCGATATVEPVKWPAGRRLSPFEHQLSQGRGAKLALRRLGWQSSNCKPGVLATCPACAAKGLNRKRS